MATALTKSQRREAEKALREAIEKIGGPKKVGDLCDGISGQAVSQWGICPDRWVLRISKESGTTATRLRPDLYPEGTMLPEAA